MAKVDFSKVEQVLLQGLLKMEVEHLLYLSDLATAFGTKRRIEDPKDLRKKDPVYMTKKLRGDLIQVKKADEEMFQSLGLDPETLKKYFGEPKSLTEEDLEEIRNIQERLTKYKEDLRKKLIEKTTDEEIITKERHKHINKRFNVKEGWLPLH